MLLCFLTSRFYKSNNVHKKYWIKISINLSEYKSTTIICVYAISEVELLHNKDVFFSKLSNVIEESGSIREVIIAEDFNGRNGKQMDSQIVGPL